MADTIAKFVAGHNEPTATNYGTVDTRTASSGDTDKSVMLVINMDDTTTEHYEAGDIMVQNYSGSGGTANIVYCMKTATSPDTVVAEIAFKSFTEDVDDFDTKSFATAVESSADTVPSASGELGYIAISLSAAQMDNVAAGEYYRVRVSRDAGKGTASPGDFQFIALELTQA